MKNLSYTAQMTRDHDRDRFLRILFLPEGRRDALFALAALNAELMQVQAHVREEMIGHIRYAWWEEAVDKLYAGTKAPAHPVLESIAPLIASGALPKEQLSPLLQTYRAHYPEIPHNAETIMDAVSLHLIHTTAPEAQARWEKASAIVAAHRKRFGGNNGWLALKLLIA